MNSDAAKAPTLLVVDDDFGVLALIDRLATEMGFSVVRRSGGRAALASLPQIRPDGAIIDVGLSDIDGLSVLREIKAADQQSQVILMTGSGSIDSAVEAIKAGALDYISKPLDLDRLRELLITVRKSLERRETLLRIDADVARQFEFYGLIGRSPGMQELFDSVRRFAPYARTVLVTGETGTGKELVAKALHKLGPRKRSAAHHRQLLRRRRNAVRERAVRPRARRVHRRDRDEDRPVRACGPRHDLPG